MTSVSTRFLGHPKLTKWMVRATRSRSLADHFGYETLEEIERVVGPRGGFGVILNAEGVRFGRGQSFAGAVVQVEMSRRCAAADRSNVDHEPVILGRDLDPIRLKILHRLIEAP